MFWSPSTSSHGGALEPEQYLKSWFLLGQKGAGWCQQSLVIGSLGWGGVWTFGTRWLLIGSSSETAVSHQPSVQQPRAGAFAQ